MNRSESRHHPSFGMISIVKGSSSEKMVLFGSSILQRSFVQIQIHNASLTRDISNDWIHPEGLPIVSIYLSPSQFADAITSLNTTGVPCTISYMDEKPVEPPVYENKRVQIDNEFDDTMRDVTSDINQYYVEIDKILSKPSIGKHDREAIMCQLRLLKQELESNLPFIKTMFTEQMDKTVIEAKNEFTAFVDDKIRSLGLEKIKDQLSLEYKVFEDDPNIKKDVEEVKK